MFPSAKKRKRAFPANHPRRDKGANTAKITFSGGQAGRGWKKSKEKAFDKKMKPAGKTFGAKKGGRDNKFGAKKKKFELNKKDKSFKSKGQKGNQGFKRKGAGAKQGFKQRKGKGWPADSSLDWDVNVLPYWCIWEQQLQDIESWLQGWWEQKCYIFILYYNSNVSINVCVLWFTITLLLLRRWFKLHSKL